MVSFGLTAASLSVAWPVCAFPAPEQDKIMLFDPLTGRALFGHDPVAYFIEGRSVMGRDDIVAEYQGRFWHFATAANRDRFRTDPGQFVPQIAGYDPIAVTNGKAALGDPTLFYIRNGQLWMFRSSQTREVFAGNRGAEKTANTAWTVLKETGRD
jgi:YHS domain-containing protein